MDINWPEILKFVEDLLVLGVIAKNCIEIKKTERRVSRLERTKCNY